MAATNARTPPAAAPAAASRFDAVVALIPALNPDRRLVDLVGALRRAGCGRIVVVDDGSDGRTAAFFDGVRGLPGCSVVRHDVNRGKGRAIKTGLAFIRERHADAAAVVTVDADGQHRPDDVASVAASFLASPDALVIGTRRFGRGTPLRSRLGNELTRRVFARLAGVRLGDTQSGLRCFPLSVVPRLLELAGERYEYEMNVLAACPGIPLAIREVGIETVYFDGNRSSYFNPILDSLRIYRLLLRSTRRRPAPRP
jgi:glycosyltransferase involved in cell wall biosynthesis